MYEKLLPRFVKFVKIDTRSDPSSKSIPTTESQITFAKVLVNELKKIGMKRVYYSERSACVFATLPSNTEKDVKSIGFIAHMDTADFNSVGINPQVVNNYDGDSDIIINEEKNIRISLFETPNLAKYKGQKIITTDGETLLGADDKAGIAEIITAMEYLIERPEIKHGKIMVAFTSDEEVGRSMQTFDTGEFDVDFAYTVDGSQPGELNFETFNAANAKVYIQGRASHPGTAKGIMVNAARLATEFDSYMPKDKCPEKTEDKEGFIYLMNISAEQENAEITYALRDHDIENLEKYKEILQKAAKIINDRLNENRVSVVIQDCYHNMKDVIEKNMYIVNLAKCAMTAAGVKPIIRSIRDGTDGSNLSFKGIPTPNIFSGAENIHGPLEFISLESMELATETIVQIVMQNERG